MTALVSINGYDFPAPSTFQSTTATIVDSARNVQGVVIGSVVRENVLKASMSWKFISASDWANMLAQFDSTRGGSFYQTATIFVQDTNQWETRTVYVSDRVSNIFLRNPDGTIKGYTDASLSLVEV